MNNAKLFFRFGCKKMFGRNPKLVEEDLFAFYYSEIVTQNKKQDIQSVYKKAFAKVFSN